MTEKKLSAHSWPERRKIDPLIWAEERLIKQLTSDICIIIQDRAPDIVCFLSQDVQKNIADDIVDSVTQNHSLELVDKEKTQAFLNDRLQDLYARILARTYNGDPDNESKTAQDVQDFIEKSLLLICIECTNLKDTKFYPDSKPKPHP